MGSISKKLKGLSAKNWAWLEIFLHSHGLRFDIRKGGGLFSKSGSADRFPGCLSRAGNESRPLDLHRAVQRERARGAAALTAGAEAAASARCRSNALTRSRPRLGLGFGLGERARHG